VSEGPPVWTSEGRAAETREAGGRR